MIDFNASQLTWIVIGACSIGGTGYLTIDSKMKDLDTKVEVTQVKVQDTNERVVLLQQQLIRIEDKLDRRGTR
jgi:hypothetical protein